MDSGILAHSFREHSLSTEEPADIIHRMECHSSDRDAARVGRREDSSAAHEGRQALQAYKVAATPLLRPVGAIASRKCT